MSKTERTKKAQEALEQVGLLSFQKAYPQQLSGGMRQRLALARSLALDSSLLLMDEPLSALDALLREDLQQLLLDLWQQKHYAQVLVTHSIEEAVFLGQRIVVMAPRPGRVAAVIQNPNLGSKDYRSSQEFFETCKQVRQALDQAIAGSKENQPACNAASGGDN